MENQPTGGNNPENVQNRFDPDAYAYKSNKNIKKVYAAGRNVFGLTGDYDDWSQDDRERVAKYCVEKEKADSFSRKLKIGAAAVTIVSALNVIGFAASAALKKKGEGTGSGTEGTTPVETSGGFGWENGGGETGNGQQGAGETNGSGTAETTGSTETSQETETNKEKKEKFQFTNEHKYYFDEDKLTGKKHDKGVIPTAFARAEQLTNDAFYNDLTDQERMLIEKGDKKAEGYDAAMNKLFAESVLRECVDSKETAGSFIVSIMSVTKDENLFKDFRGKDYKQVVDQLYKQDDEANKKCLMTIHDEIINGKQTEEKKEGKFGNWHEIDKSKENPDRPVELRPMESEYKNGMWLTRVDLKSGGTIWVRILVRNAGNEYNTNTKNREFRSRTPDGDTYYGCGQPLTLIVIPNSDPDPKHPPNKPGNPGKPTPPPSESKNEEAAKNQAGENNTKVGSGKKTNRSNEGYQYSSYNKPKDNKTQEAINNANKKHSNDVHAGTKVDKRTKDNNDVAKKANDDATKNRNQGKTNETISDKDAAKKFGF